MYGNNILIEFYKMMPLLNLNLMNNKVVELEELYFVAENYFQLNEVGFGKIKNNKVY